MTALKYLSLICAFMALTTFAKANPVNGDVSIGSSVKSSCLISHQSSIDFGEYNPIIVRSSDATLPIQVKCTAGSTGVKLVIGPGQNPWIPFSCGYPRRHMAGPGGVHLRYYLFTKYVAGQNLNYWGCAPGLPPQPGDAKTETLPAFTKSNITQEMIVHARIYGGQDVTSGVYRDSVNVGVVF